MGENIISLKTEVWAVECTFVRTLDSVANMERHCTMRELCIALSSAGATEVRIEGRLWNMGKRVRVQGFHDRIIVTTLWIRLASVFSVPISRTEQKQTRYARWGPCWCRSQTYKCVHGYTEIRTGDPRTRFQQPVDGIFRMSSSHLAHKRRHSPSTSNPEGLLDTSWSTNVPDTTRYHRNYNDCKLAAWHSSKVAMHLQERKVKAKQYTCWSPLYRWENEIVRGDHGRLRDVRVAGYVLKTCRNESREVLYRASRRSETA